MKLTVCFQDLLVQGITCGFVFSRTFFVQFPSFKFQLANKHADMQVPSTYESNTDRGLWKGIPIHIYSTFTYITRLWFPKSCVFTPTGTWGNDPIWLFFFQMDWFNHQLDLASVYGMFLFVLTININRSSYRCYGKGTCFFLVEGFHLQAANFNVRREGH